jgi:class 3 adenylate cyclase/tetratricopeptide (TPR) repeat protein
MICPDCRHENPDRSLFCNQCGARQIVPDDANGVETSGEGDAHGERRPLTVLFCDMVGSTQLAERVDPEELREILARYHAESAAVIKRFEGYVAQYLGDGILVYFGYPQAHEDDAERATRSALEIQRRLTECFPDGRVRARIGIHTGLVFVGEIGNDARRETLALGGATNVAARIEQVAEPGGVVISEQTYRQTVGVFARDLGERELKGLEHPMHLYAVDRVFGGRRRHDEGAEIPMQGRDDELGRLCEAFESTRAGQGRTVLISGEPGIGKSRLVVGLRSEPRATPRLWVDMACSPYTSGSALRPAIDLFEERFAIPTDVGREQQSKVVADGLAQMPGLDREAVVPYLLALLGLPPHDDYPLPTIAPEQQRERTMVALCAIIEALTAIDVVVLQVEDLQWSDPSTLELLGRLVELAPRSRLLLVLTARSDFVMPWKEAHVERVKLERLATWPILEMIGTLTKGRSLPTTILRRIAERSDGVPLFVEQLVYTVFESELVDDRGDHLAVPPGLESQVVPATLRGSLMARLDRLGTAKRIAQLAATIGREFSYELLEKVAGLTPDALRDGLDRLRQSEIVESRGSPPSETYRFKHALLQETAYQSQLHSDRRTTHARVADAMTRHFPESVASEPDLVAHHYAEAKQFDPAASHYQAAGSRAAERFANDEATRYLRLALDALAELPDDDARRERELSIALAMAPPLTMKQGLDHADVTALHERIASMCSAAGEGVAQLPALLYLSRYHLRRGAAEESTEVGSSILRIAQAAEIPLMEVVGRVIVGSAEVTRSPSSEAIAHLERALEVARSVDLPPATSALEPDLLAFVHATMGVSYAVGGRLDDALEHAQAARARAEAIDHEATTIFVLGLSTVTLSLMTAYETVIEWGREALERAEGRGFYTSEAQARTMVGWARVATGDEAGLEEAEAGLGQAIHMGFRAGLGHYVFAAATANRLAARHERAHELLNQIEEIMEATGEKIFAGRIRRERAMVYIGEGRTAQAEAELFASLALLERDEAPVERLMAATELFRLARGRGGEREARTRLKEIAAATPGGDGFRPQKAARELLEATA